jgi:MarR-like DNA-binding transcriptional regulator SgrR of sgrS sRNA
MIRNPDISRPARLLLVVIKSYAPPNGGPASPARKTLCEHMQCSENSLDKWLNELRDAGILNREKQNAGGKGRKSSLYFLLDDPVPTPNY